MKIIQIEGVGHLYAEKMAARGIRTTDHLLAAGATRRGREQLAEKTGISEKLILSWVNLADLIRVPGIGEEYSDLLEESGVDTVLELRNRNPANLHAHLIETNVKRKLVRRVPSLREVTSWVGHAKKLPRGIFY
jgi:predicted flap endonuclease-1-like 5' DNA nuclease